MTNQVTYEQVLIDRLSIRLGQMAVTMEAQQLQIESLSRCLRDNGVDPETLQPIAEPVTAEQPPPSN